RLRGPQAPAGPEDAPRGDRRAGAVAAGARGVRRGGGRALPPHRAARAADLRPGRDRLGADAGLRAHLTASVAVIVNPAAGLRGQRAGHRRVALAEAVLAARRAPGSVHLTEGPGHAFELARAAVAARATVVCAWGGDGTVNEITCAVAGSGTALAIVPAGSGNGLARELGIPWDPTQALGVALGPRERVIDVGDAGGRLFVNLCGIGLDAHVAARF